MAAPTAGTIPYAPKVVRDYLITKLDADVRVSTYVPTPRPAKLVVISTVPTGDPGNIALSPRRCTLYVSHADELTAGNLSETVCGHLKAAKFVPGNGIRNVSVVGTPARLDDPDDNT